MGNRQIQYQLPELSWNEDGKASCFVIVVVQGSELGYPHSKGYGTHAPVGIGPTPKGVW